MTTTRTQKLIASATVGAGLIAGTFGIAALGTGVAGAAPANPTAATAAHVLGEHPALRHLARSEFKVAADTIGVKPAELRDAVKGGQSIADVATAKGVSVDAVVNAVVADASAKIDQAVAAGKLTQEQADKAKARLPQLVTKAVNFHRAAK